MRNRKHFLKLNNKGASMVTVILTIAFLTILVSVVMMTSLINYRMKRVNAYAKDTFYSAEQVLDEINVGLQRYMSDSLSEAYMEIMENYNDYTVDTKRELLQTKYYESMWTKLQKDDKGNSVYDTTKLYALLKDSTEWHGTAEDGFGAIVGVMNATGVLGTEGVMETYDNGIVLKDLRVYYKDSKGFVSIIETDVRMTYPAIDFATTTSLPNVSSYGFVADAGLVVKGQNELKLTGNFFADSLINTDFTYNNDTTKKLSHIGDGKVVIKHEMELQNASFSNETEGTLWAEGIKTISGDLYLNGETLLADDLDINGDGSRINISGIFNGYGSSIEDANKSSAILVNGSNSAIDFSAVERFTVAGHSFVGTRRPNVTDMDEAEDTETDKEINIYSGESIAVKSNQLMYMVPPECIGILNASGKSLYNKNPLTTKEYEEIQDYIGEGGAIEVSTTTEVAKLGGATLAAYVQLVNGEPQFEKVFVPTNDPNQSLVYYYLKFPNEQTANDYFELYYNANKEVYDRYIKSYVDVLTFPSNGVATIRTAGHGIEGSRAEAVGYTMVENTIDNAASQLSDNEALYQNRFVALCTRLMENYEDIAGAPFPADENGQILFDNLVNEANLISFIEEVAGPAATEAIIDDPAHGKIVLVNRDITDPYSYTITDENVHLVIARGNVVIDCPNFKGTVIANGTVTVEQGVNSITVDEALVNALLRCTTTIDGNVVMVANVLWDGEEYMYAIENAEDNDKEITSMADLIIYENWKRE